jgi:hypothetical protein
VIAFTALWLLLSAFTVIYQLCHSLPTSGNRWRWLLSCNQNMPIHRQYVGRHIRACAIACKITVSNTCGLYWEFYNIQCRCHRLSAKGHNIPCISRIPILEGKDSCQKCGLYTHKYGIPYLSKYHMHDFLGKHFCTQNWVNTSFVDLIWIAQSATCGNTQDTIIHLATLVHVLLEGSWYLDKYSNISIWEFY